MPVPYAVLDVFTGEALAGNPLAVVLDADQLPDEALQKIAAEFNLSETIFVFPAEHDHHSARVRIFTPALELPFAGHPTVGCAILLGLNRLTGEGERDGIIVLEEGIGPVRVGVKLTDDRSFAEFDVPKSPIRHAHEYDTDLVSAALGLTPREIGFENHKPSRFGFEGGPEFDFVPVRDLSVQRRIEVDSRLFDDVFGDTGHAYVYCRDTISVDSAFHARSFAPGAGVAEDPATGSAVAAFAGVIQLYDQPVAGEHEYQIEQGDIMGRPSRIKLELALDAGRIENVRIGGEAVVVARGPLEI